MPEELNVPELTHKQKQENRIAERVFLRVKELMAQHVDKSNLPRLDELDRFARFMESTRVLAASAVLAAMSGAIYAYLALMGVTALSPARVVLCCAWFFGLMFAWEITMQIGVRRQKLVVMVLAAFVFAAIFIGLDRWTRSWQRNHPSETAELRVDVHENTAKVEELLTKSVSSRVVPNEVAVKELQAVPGYLRRKMGYPQIPIVQPNKPAEFNVIYENPGSTYVHNAVADGAIFYVDFRVDNPPTHSAELKTQLTQLIAKRNLLVKGDEDDIGPGEATWTTYETTETLTPDMVAKIVAGTARIYLLAMLNGGQTESRTR